MNSHAAVTFSCAPHTLLLFMISFGVSWLGLIWGTGGLHSSGRDTCNAGVGERDASFTLVWGMGKGFSESPKLQRESYSESTLPLHLRYAGTTLVSVRFTWAWGGDEMTDCHLVPCPLLTGGIFCYQQVIHSWGANAERDKKLMGFGVLWMRLGCLDLSIWHGLSSHLVSLQHLNEKITIPLRRWTENGFFDRRHTCASQGSKQPAGSECFGFASFLTKVWICQSWENVPRSNKNIHLKKICLN